ncbi:hypothetical protein ATKI12_1358 [Kitasatospora sp. Ki12]|uniref:hypothetical protein n=1 Tax=Kitasatospora xanthocidica TaxID=83382 RepID=UPI001671EE52|nr:hypothetical protein [Kitasatospora xanthocidica]GHF64548.1 hypothetical protein GCM10018790_47940 [Kitasatospora xanthocidica]
MNANEKLIAGYVAYTTTEEYSLGLGGDTLASVESVSWIASLAASGAVVSASVSATVKAGC